MAAMFEVLTKVHIISDVDRETLERELDIGEPFRVARTNSYISQGMKVETITLRREIPLADVEDEEDPY